MAAPPGDYKGDYKYDVFFSYKRHGLTLDWTKEIHKRLRFWLSEELARDASFFVDEDSIEVGTPWPQELKEGLRLSRCMVAVWSPSYFQSDWCLSEWTSFREREKRLDIQSHRLIAPMRFHDGEHFPEDARNVQWTDVAPYAYTVRAFWTSQRALELEDVLKAFAASVARIVRAAPPFQADWPIVETPAPPAMKIDLARL
jgi:TIR domain